jgi:dihydroorotate dehydrogenase electron transfer subunit
MDQSIFTIKENIALNPNVFRMTLEGAAAKGHKPGQFVNLQLDGCYLRRPISVCDSTDTTLTIMYKVVGSGTEILSKMQAGEKADVLTHLGNCFDVSADCAAPLLIGGGIGCPPLYKLAKELIGAGKKPRVLLGFNDPSEIILEDDFKALGLDVTVVTKGFVTQADIFVNGDFDYIYTCGPIPMLKAIYNGSNVSGQYSFEERMGCGFGACMGCSCKTKYGNKRICKDGPVLVKEEIIW